jgi:putative zinc finger protein
MTNRNMQALCGRKEDLIAYLYQEANAEERASFERHLDDCHSCRDECSAFARVREDLSAWEVDYTPRTEIVLPKSRQKSLLDSLREFVNFFPVWARGASLTALSLSLLIISFSFAKRDSLMKSDRIEALVKAEVARERSSLEQEYRAQIASYQVQLKAENEMQLRTLVAQQEAKLQAAKAELRRYNQRNSSFRSFFAMDDPDDPGGDYR